MSDFLHKAYRLYYDGFREMTVGKTLWAVILIKLAIMFLVLKIFFFPSHLRGMDSQERADYVSGELVGRGADDDTPDSVPESAHED